MLRFRVRTLVPPYFLDWVFFHVVFRYHYVLRVPSGHYIYCECRHYNNAVWWHNSRLLRCCITGPLISHSPTKYDKHECCHFRFLFRERIYYNIELALSCWNQCVSTAKIIDMYLQKRMYFSILSFNSCHSRYKFCLVWS